MIGANDCETLTQVEQDALLDFFMLVADHLDGGDSDDIEHLKKSYAKMIQNNKHPLSILYGKLCDINSGTL